MKRFLPTLITMLGDYVAIVVAEFFAFFLRNSIDFWYRAYYFYSYSYIFIFVPGIFIIFLLHSNSYRQMKPITETMHNIFMAVIYGWVAAIIVIYFLKASNQTSRFFIFLLLPNLLATVCFIRVAILKFFKNHNLFVQEIIVVGTGKTAEKLTKFWIEDWGYRYKIAGFIDDNADKNFEVLGGFDKIKYIVHSKNIKNVVIAIPDMPPTNLNNIIAQMQPQVENISFIPNLIDTPMASADISVLFSQKILALNLKNNLANPINRAAKRIFDLCFTITAVILTAPFLLLITIVVAVLNRGNPFFAHRRIGKSGKHFLCYKFKTMNSNFDLDNYLNENPEAKKEWEENFKLNEDPRVTKIGQYLRKYSVDELPQLWNVIKGDMSLVGPRPIVDEEIVKYGKAMREYCMVLPGITGMWQVSGRSNTTYAERVEMDTWYVRNWSVWIDLIYLAKTFKAVLKAEGAY